MKNIFIFLAFLIIGIVGVGGYYLVFQPSIPLSVKTQPITTKFSLANAPSESLKGKIASLSGTVNWTSRTATKSVKLNSKVSVQQGEELMTTKNGHAAVVIQNAEAVIMSPDSDVSFTQMLPVNIVLDQQNGTVIYQNIGKSALSVTTLDLVTTVNRALAGITVDPTAGTVTVIVQKGEVNEGYEDLQDNSNTITIDAGQKFVFNDNQRTGTIE